MKFILILAMFFQPKTPEPYDYNTVTYGVPRVGKTSLVLLEEIQQAIDARNVSVWVCDPHRGLGLSTIAYALAKGHGRRLVVDDHQRFNEVASLGFIGEVRANSPDQREEESLAVALDLADSMVAGRGSKYGGLDDKVQIREWLVNLAMGGLYQPPGYDWSRWHCVTQPWTDEFDAFVNGIQYPFYKERVAFLKRFNTAEKLYQALGPTTRLIMELYSYPSFRRRINATVNAEEFVKAKGIYIVLGNGSPASRANIRSVHLRGISLVRSHHGRTGEPLWLRLFSDEVSTERTLGLAEARSMNAQLKQGLSWSVISHSPRYGDDEVDMLVDQGCTRKYLMKHSPSAAEENAGQLHPTIDPYKEHSRTERERTVFDGYEEIDVVSYGETKDHEGHKREDVRRGKQQRARQKPIVDVDIEYMKPHDQVLLNAVELIKLGKRMYYLVDGANVSGPHRTRDVKDPWRFPGLAEKKFEAHLQWQLNVGVSRPVADMSPDPESNPEKAAPAVEVEWWPAEAFTPSAPPVVLPDPFAGLDDATRVQRKRERLAEDMKQKPVTAPIIKEEGEFGSDSARDTWVARRKKSGEFIVVGLVSGGGRPAELLMHRDATWKPKADNGWHERAGTVFEFALRRAHPDLVSQRGKPTAADEDMLLTFRGQAWLVEVECGTEGKKQFTGKFPKLKSSALPVLIPVSCKGGGNEKRIADLLEWLAEDREMAGKVYLCDLERLVADPGGFVWVRPGKPGYCRPLPGKKPEETAG